jgi:hypothetical protein
MPFVTFAQKPYQGFTMEGMKQKVMTLLIQRRPTFKWRKRPGLWLHIYMILETSFIQRFGMGGC